MHKATKLTGPPPVPSLTIAEIKDEMWQEVARYHEGSAPSRQIIHATAPAPAPAEPLPLDSLLALDGAAFVEAAYRTLLGRPADQAGASYFMRELEAGRSKIVLLGQLQRSPEATAAGQALPGLRSRYMAHRLYGVPVVGRAARVAAMVLRRTGMSGALVGAKSVSLRRTEIAATLEQVSAAQAALGRHAQEQAAAIEAISRRIGLHEDSIRTGGQFPALETALQRLVAQDETNQHLAATIAGQGRTLSGLVAQSASAGRRLAAVEDSTLESMVAMADTLAEHGARLARIEGLLNGEAIAAQIDGGARALRQSLDERLDRAEAIVAQNRQEVIDQERRIGLMLDALRRQQGAPMPEALQAQDDRSVEALYVTFEDRFRGSRADIKERLRFYLPILAEAQAGEKARPIVDVGCGRGEFLELLREEGLEGRGVDANGAMAAACQALGLDCAAADALEYLSSQPPGSLGAVTGFHIIEHLPFRTMVRLFDAVLRALAPGGLVVFETPNPANLLVASRWFYLDPTHRNPLPGEMVAMIAEARGFSRISIVEMHPMERRFGGNDPVLREQLDRFFFGPQDYALLARKP